MLLTSILFLPLLAGLLCLFARPRRLVEILNLAAFAGALILGLRLVHSVLAAPGGAVTEWREFLRADALSAWMVLLISVRLAGQFALRRELISAATSPRPS